LPCDRCNRLRLTADGYLLPCLKSQTEIKVDFDDLEGCFARAVNAKPTEGTSNERRSMREIGG
jgi:cyclic pyranopterin phosphate synthase